MKFEHIYSRHSRLNNGPVGQEHDKEHLSQRSLDRIRKANKPFGGIPYLGWYQAITLADLGAADASQQMVLKTRNYDARLIPDPRHWEIGRRQYTQLRRFLEQYLLFLRHHSLIGKIAQELQWGAAS